jgi:hypothetical protein
VGTADRRRDPSQPSSPMRAARRAARVS